MNFSRIKKILISFFIIFMKLCADFSNSLMGVSKQCLSRRKIKMEQVKSEKKIETPIEQRQLTAVVV